MDEFIGLSIDQFAPVRVPSWAELVLATPAVLWGGGSFFVCAWQSVISRNLNMFTLIGLGTDVAYLYSVVAIILPDLFPKSFPELHRPATTGSALWGSVALVGLTATSLRYLGLF